MMNGSLCCVESHSHTLNPSSLAYLVPLAALGKENKGGEYDDAYRDKEAHHAQNVQ